MNQPKNLQAVSSGFYLGMAMLGCLALAAVANGQPTWSDLGAGSLPGMRGGSSGRVGVIAVEPGANKVIYIGTPGGGVWKTADAGVTWSPLTDAMPSNSIGSIAIDPNDFKTVYVGTGEANGVEHSFYGLGVYRSRDGGSTWVQLPTLNGSHDPSVFDGRCIGRIVVDPNDSTHLFAAVSTASQYIQYGQGHQYGHGAVGIFTSHDSGDTWQRITALGGEGYDIAHVSGTDFLAVVASGGYISHDGGITWTRTLVTSVRLTLAVAPPLPGSPDIVYAVGGSGPLSVWRSQSGGMTWDAPVQVSLSCASFYSQAVTVDRFDRSIIYAGCINLFKVQFLSGGGVNISTLTPDNTTNEFHEDQHALAWDASNRLLVGNDGGLTRSTYQVTIPDAPPIESWQHLDSDSLGITQVVPGLSPDPADPNVIYAGTQDNCDMREVDQTREWETPPLLLPSSPPSARAGDGGFTLIDPWIPSSILAGMNGSAIWVSVDGGVTFARRSPGGTIGGVLSPPFVIDPTVPAPGQHGAVVQGSGRLNNFVYNSTSATFVPIGGTTGGHLPDDCRARGLAVAPGAEEGGLWGQFVYIGAGHFDELEVTPPNVPDTRSQDYSVLQASADGGTTLYGPDHDSAQDLRDNEFMQWPHGTREVAVDPVEPMVAFAVSGMWGDSPVRKRFWRTKDGGHTWEGADGASPGGLRSLPFCPLNSVAVISAPGLLRKVLVGTDQGVYLSNDDGDHWAKYGLGMPNTFVYDLVVDMKYNRLLAGTMGRGIWSVQLPCVADIDDGSLTGTPDGIVDIRDYIAFFQWLATGEHSTDINRDGDNGTDADIEVFMQHYLNGC